MKKKIKMNTALKKIKIHNINNTNITWKQKIKKACILYFTLSTSI